MAYGKKKGYKRPYRKSRKLSNYNIATKTSARAQSKQIYALKKRVNQIYRLTKPETQIQTRSSVSPLSLTGVTAGGYSFVQDSSSNTSYNVVPSVFWATAPSSTGGTSEPVNNWVRSYSFTLYGNWQYNTVDSANTPLTLRIVILQTKKTRSDSITADDVFTNSDSTAGPRFSAVYGPLQDGITATGRVLSDKRYNLNFQRPNVSIKTALRYLYNFRRDTAAATSSGGSEGVPAGSINVFYALYGIGPSGATTTLSTSTLNLMYKLAWSDN